MGLFAQPHAQGHGELPVCRGCYRSLQSREDRFLSLFPARADSGTAKAGLNVGITLCRFTYLCVKEPIKRQLPDAALKPLFKGRINRQLIIDYWDEMLRVAGSLKRGWVTASLLIGKLRSFPESNQLLQALQEYGRLVKTLFILRYLNQEDYRRCINRQLNRGESIHALRRFLLFARQGELRSGNQKTSTINRTV